MSLCLKYSTKEYQHSGSHCNMDKGSIKGKKKKHKTDPANFTSLPNKPKVSPLGEGAQVRIWIRIGSKGHWHSARGLATGNFGRPAWLHQTGIPDEDMFMLAGRDSHFWSVRHQFNWFKQDLDKTAALRLIRWGQEELSHIHLGTASETCLPAC